MRAHIASLLLMVSLVTGSLVQANELMVYSSKGASYLQPLLDEYSRETGTPMQFKVASAQALLFVMENEINSQPVDLFITSGAFHLELAAQRNLLAAVNSRSIERYVAEYLQSSDGYWFGFARRARTIVYHPARVDKKQLSTYADLAQPNWQGRLCLLTSADEYSQSFVSMLLSRYGPEKMSTVLSGWVANLGHEPMTDDLQVIQAIDKGECDVGIVNSYYFARHLIDVNPESPLKLYWADQDDGGVVVDVSGIAVAAGSPNPEQALDFIDWLLGKDVQALYSSLSMEYPVRNGVYPPRQVAKWGTFKESEASLMQTHALREQALSLIEQAEYR